MEYVLLNFFFLTNSVVVSGLDEMSSPLHLAAQFELSSGLSTKMIFGPKQVEARRTARKPIRINLISAGRM